MLESGFALAVAFLINVSVISVSGAVCSSSNLNPEDQASCKDLDLNKASFLLRVCERATFLRYFILLIVLFMIAISIYCLQNVLGSWSSKLFAIALLASGQSSTITGTYAGQYVMQVLANNSGSVPIKYSCLSNENMQSSLRPSFGVE